MDDEGWEGTIILALTALVILMMVVGLLILPVQARDDGRYAKSPLKPWFDQLSSAKGRCCSNADGFAVSDPDWESRNGHYRVRLNGQWVDVPDDAVIKEPNLYGPTLVWPLYLDGAPEIRCFLPGVMM